MPQVRTSAALCALLATSLPFALAPDAHASAGAPRGAVTTAVQNTFTHRLHISGWAYDRARPRASVRVRLYVGGNFVGRVRADERSPRADRKFHIAGRHKYSLTVTRKRRAGQVVAKSIGAVGPAPLRKVGTRSVTHFYPPPGARIVDVARKYVGSRYVYGGASPAGFDCSGYTKYAYGQAHVRTLVHNAEGQRRSMRRIRRSHARPGDLVFYMSGGAAYHVAVFAGHGWQYSATTPGEGVRHQRIWASNIRFGTDWH